MRPVITLLALATAALASPVEVRSPASTTVKHVTPAKPTGYIVVKNAANGKFVGYLSKNWDKSYNYQITAYKSKAMIIYQPNSTENTSIYNINPNTTEATYPWLSIYQSGGGPLDNGYPGYGFLTGGSQERSDQFSYNPKTNEITAMYYDNYYYHEANLTLAKSTETGEVLYSGDLGMVPSYLPHSGALRSYFRRI